MSVTGTPNPRSDHRTEQEVERAKPSSGQNPGLDLRIPRFWHTLPMLSGARPFASLWEGPGLNGEGTVRNQSA